MTDYSEVKNDERYVKYLDKGFVGLVEVMGSDETIDEDARNSYGKGTRKTNKTEGLIRYLMRHRHTSPFEMAEVKFRMKIPIFVCRQLIRHRTANVNELSGRYSEMPDEFYQPDAEMLRPQSKVNKQGSENKSFTGYKAERVLRLLDRVANKSFEVYKKLLLTGLARETARINLPLSTYTELTWKIDLNNFFKFLSLRDDPHAQEQIRILAGAMAELVRPHFPISFRAYDDYMKGAVTFSRPEMKILLDVLGLIDYDDLDVSGLSEREVTEFFNKIRHL